MTKYTLFLSAWIGFLILVLAPQSQAQQVSDSLWLDEVRVQANRIYVADHYQPSKIVRVDSSQIQLLGAESLAQVLNLASPVFVRTNGPGGLATFSNRGFSASQTQVLWNGFALNHPMLGLTDLTLIPAFLVDEVVTASGDGNTSLGEKGGGTVAFSNRSLNNEIVLSTGFGSFNSINFGGGAGSTLNNWEISLHGEVSTEANNFEYTVPEFSNEAGGFVELTRSRENNAREFQTGIFTANRNWKDSNFKTMMWLYNSSNQIPGGVSSLSSGAYQNDGFMRLMTSYSSILGRQSFRARTYLNTQKLNYYNPSSSLESESRSYGVTGDLEMKTSLHQKMQLISAIQLSRFWVNSNQYSSKPIRSSVSANLNSIWHPLHFLHVYNALRAEYFSDFDAGWSANSGFNANIWEDWLILYGQVSRNYVTPTFNDLYWPGQGNAALKPESIQKGELGMRIRLGAGFLQQLIEIALYRAYINDGIRWLPAQSGLSRPLNIDELNLRGFELSTEHQIKTAEWSFLLKTTLTQSLASISKSRFAGDAAVGKQLFYTPEWQIKGFTSANWKKFSASLAYNYTDERYTTIDHSSRFDPLSSYKLLNTTIMYQLPIQRSTTTLGFSVFNLLDERYAVIRDYPMPGRYFKIKITTHIKTKQTQ